MAVSRKKHLTPTLSYWFLLTYIIAALVWWFITLQKQSDVIASLELQLLEARSAEKTSPSYQEKINSIKSQQKRSHAKYISEGATFLLLTLVGAFFVFRSARKQIQLQQ